MRRWALLAVVLSVLFPVCLEATPPIITSLDASSTVVSPGGTTSLTLNAYDPDCGQANTCVYDGNASCDLIIEAALTDWTASGGSFVAGSIDLGTDESPYSSSATWQAPETEGTYTVSVQITDWDGGLCGWAGGVPESASANLLVQVGVTNNNPPTIDSFTAVPAQILPGDSSQLTCVGSDPDGEAISYAWASDVGTVTPGTDGQATFTSGSPGGATVTCTVTDPAGAPAQDSVSISVSGALAESAIYDTVINPQRVAVGSAGHVYVVDRALEGITVLNLETGALLYRLAGLPGITDVTSVAVDWDGDLLIGTLNGARVISPLGDFRFELPNTSQIADVAVDLVNQRYGVLNRNSGRVQVFDSNGQTEVGAFGSTGSTPEQLRGPYGLAAAPDGTWVVGDTGNSAVKIFNLDGTLVHSFGELGGGFEEFTQLYDVAVGPDGVIYATDSRHDRIQAFNPDGTFREAFGTYGDGVGEFKNVTGVTYSTTFDRLIGGSFNSSSLQIFRTSNTPVSVLGQAVPTVAPSSLVFTEVAVGYESAPQGFTLTNTGDVPLGIVRLSVKGPFTFASTCPPALGAGASCSVQVIFVPGSVGPHSGTLTFETNGQPARVVATLTGSGYTPLPDVVVAPATLTFPDQQVATISPPQQVTLTNNGLAPLTITDISVAGEYLQSNICPPVLGAGESCFIDVQFAPISVAELLSGTVKITSDAASSPHTVSLSGRSTPVVPTVFITDLPDWVSEGEDGDGVTATFTVKLSEPTSELVSVDFATADGLAIDGEDYEAQAGTIDFPAGEIESSVVVSILGDDILEPDLEDFQVEITSPVNAVLGVDTATAEISDDEPCVGPNLVVNWSAEENLPGGNEIAGWTVVHGDWSQRLAPPSAVDGSYNFYAIFDPAVDNLADLYQDVDLRAYADKIDQGNQWFAFEANALTLYESATDSAEVVVEYLNEDGTVALETFTTGPFSSPSVWMPIDDARVVPSGTRWARIWLISNEPGDAYFDGIVLRSLRAAAVMVADWEAYEGDADFQTALFGVELTCPFYEDVSVDYATSDATASSQPGVEDYVPTAGSLSLPSGETTETIAVDVLGDTVDEDHEAFFLDLALVEPSEAMILDDEGLGLIFNDDFCPQAPAYWVARPDWPEAASWIVIGGIEYPETALRDLLGYSGSDQSHVLARELVATKLNLLEGSKPGVIQPVVEQADAFLEEWPPGSRPNGGAKKEAVEISSHLAEYNSAVCP